MLIEPSRSRTVQRSMKIQRMLCWGNIQMRSRGSRRCWRCSRTGRCHLRWWTVEVKWAKVKWTRSTSNSNKTVAQARCSAKWAPKNELNSKECFEAKTNNMLKLSNKTSNSKLNSLNFKTKWLTATNKKSKECQRRNVRSLRSSDPESKKRMLPGKNW